MKTKRTFSLVMLIVLLILFSVGVLYKNSLNDTTAPVITIFDRTEVEYMCPNNQTSPYVYTAFDNIDGDITDKVEIIYEDYQIIWKVTDEAGNITEVFRTIERYDDEAPVISLNGKKVVYVKQNTTYEDLGVTIADNCDTNLTYQVNGMVDTSKLGRYTLRYVVRDSSLNEAEELRQVVVYKDENIPDNSGYTVKKEGPTYINDILIVNKEYSIPSDFTIDDTMAQAALKDMQTAGRQIGYTLNVVSSYRSYNTQNNLYNRYVVLYGQELADTISARPGHSEHQTGLAFDIGDLGQDYAETKEGKWLAENCYKYGFIIRYPKGKEYITGYSYEPWHIRYVGIEVATEIMMNNLTLEEYLGLA